MNIVIYSKPECSFCEKSKEYLKKGNHDFTVIDIDPKKPGYTIDRDALFYKYNHKSFPLILINDKFIGGYTQLISVVQPKISFDEDF
jgi:glutaredoxin